LTSPDWQCHATDFSLDFSNDLLFEADFDIAQGLASARKRRQRSSRPNGWSRPTPRHAGFPMPVILMLERNEVQFWHRTALAAATHDVRC